MKKILLILLLTDFLFSQEPKLDCYKINQFKEADILKCLKLDPYKIRYLDNPSIKTQQLVAELNPSAAANEIKNIDFNVAENIFKYADHIELKNFKEPSPKIELLAVKYLKKPFKYYSNPTKEAQLLAIEKNVNNIFNIKNPSKEVIKKAIEKNYRIVTRLTLNNEMKLFAIKQNLKVFNLITLDKKSQDYFFKTTKFLDKDLAHDKKLELLKKYPFCIKYIKNPTEEEQLIAINSNSYALNYIKTPVSEKIKLTAIKRSPNVFKQIKNPSFELQKEAVKANAKNIQYIKEQKEELQILAVQSDGYAIEYIENPSLKVEEISLRETRTHSVSHIKKPNLALLERYISIYPKEQEYVTNYMPIEVSKILLKYNGALYEAENYNKAIQTDEIRKIAIKQYPKAIFNMENPSLELITFALKQENIKGDFLTNPTKENLEEAVTKSYWAIAFVENPSDELKKIAVESNNRAINFIKNPSKELLKIAKKDTFNIYDIKKLSEDEIIKFSLKNPKVFDYIRINKYSKKFKKSALKNNGLLIKDINYQSEELQLIAVTQNPDAVKLIKKPTKKTIHKALSLDGNLINKIYPLASTITLFEAIQNNKSLWANLKDTSKIDSKTADIALKQKGTSLKMLQSKDIKEQLEAIKKAPWGIRFLKDQPRELCLEAIRLEPALIIVIKNPSEELQVEVVKQDANSLIYLKNPSEVVKLEAIKKNPLVISLINSPSKELQHEAINQNPKSLLSIAYPDIEVQNLALKKDKTVDKYKFINY
ncbi:MAG: hypothetical protein C0625_03535 [Arcobacter sp.]|nr:MAG: hypothetical protein C0625_03535 [Arcobacter sp.]